MAHVARPHHEIDPRRAVEDGLPFLLGHAAADADAQFLALALHLAKPAEVRKHFLLRLVADRAGIEKDEVRLPFAFHAAVTAQLQTTAEALAVEIVHLTAPGFDEKGLGHGVRRSSIVSQDESASRNTDRLIYNPPR